MKATGPETKGESKASATAGVSAPRSRKAAGTRKGGGPARRSKKTAGEKARTARKGFSRGRSATLEKVFENLASKALEVGEKVANLSGEGAIAARRALVRLAGAYRKTVERLTRDWKAMDPKRKAQVIAAILAALAAASVPIIRRRMKKR